VSPLFVSRPKQSGGRIRQGAARIAVAAPAMQVDGGAPEAIPRKNEVVAMGVETRVFAARTGDLEQAAQAVQQWLIQTRGFQSKLMARTADGYMMRLEKSDFGRQLTGMVYTLDITLTRQDGSVAVRVDDGDIRNQLLALGIGAIVLWPLLLTAGYGWIQKGELRSDVIAKFAEALQATM
jgi:hypothetical protein